MSNSVERPLIRGEQIWLRAFEPRDLEPYHAAINDYDLAYWTGHLARGPLSRDYVQLWYEETVLTGHRKTGYYYVIAPLGSDEFIGSTWLFNVDSRLGGPELAIFVSDRERWSTGVGTDAIRALTDFGFGYQNFNRIWLTSRASNLRAHGAFRNAGFALEGTLRAHYRAQGEVVDSVLMSLLRTEWEGLERPRSWDY
jgi:RimJ/RimL family protein N-acetyltransferase